MVVLAATSTTMEIASATHLHPMRIRVATWRRQLVTQARRARFGAHCLVSIIVHALVPSSSNSHPRGINTHRAPGTQQGYCYDVSYCVRAPGTCRGFSAACKDTEHSFASLPQDVEQRFKGIERWIMFSDLHVHQRHSPHWKSALDCVRSAAAERQAGCLFLVRLPGWHCSPHNILSAIVML